jgi:hypothetical protein
MCFSATASFTAAAITGGIGLLTLQRVTNRAEVPLAAVPLLFGLQQAIEGGLWLTLDDAPFDPGLVQALTYGFLFVAEVWWPIFVPVAVLLAESDKRRRRLLWPLLPLGVAVGLSLLWAILTREHHAMIVDEHLVYAAEGKLPFGIAAAYLGVVVLPPLLSSHRAVALLGAIVLVGAATAYIVYWQAFVSVWCFFAAIASGVIFWHFERERRQHDEGLTT